MKLILGLYSFFILVFCASAQFNNPGNFSGKSNYDFYDNRNGMSQGTVNAIVQDKYGYIWLGTQDGLNKFDGKKFTIFKNIHDDSSSLSDNYITAIVEDKRGDLWIGTKSGGLNKYDIRTNVFKSYRLNKNNNNSISHNSIHTLKIDNNGLIWVGTAGGGLNSFNSKTNEFQRYLSNPDDKSSLASNSVYSLLFDSNNILWVGTDDGLNRFNNAKNTFQRFDNRSQKTPVKQSIIYTIWEDKNKNLWLGTDKGLKILNNDYKEITDVSTFTNEESKVGKDIILDIKNDQKGNLWIATDGNFLKYLDINSGKITTHKVSFPRVQTIFIDKVEDIWVGLRGGLNRFGKLNAKFTQYIADSEGKALSPHSDIHALLEDQEGYLWIGSSVDGLKRLNRQTLEVVDFQNKPNIETSLSNNNIRFLTDDSYGNIWVATYNGLNKFNLKSQKFTAYKPDNSKNSISDKFVHSIFEDSKKQLWVSTSNGLNIFNPKTEKFRVLKNDPLNSNSIASNNVNVVYEDSRGIIWIGLSANGLDKYDPQKNTFIHYTHNKKDPKSLTNDRVFGIHEDKNGNIWVATYGGGLNKLERKKEVFTHFGIKDGLANEALYCVIEDENNHLWMSHNEGFSKFDIEREVFKNYFQGVEFNSGAFFKSKSGEIFFGTNSVVAFEPKTLKDNTNIPAVHINTFNLFNEQITPLSNSGLVKNILEETKSLTLNYNQNFFSFEFIALNYTHPENNKYKYKLENFDQEWNLANEFQHATYTNVPPGEYVFKVQGSNNDGLWNQEGDSIVISILSPWWGTLWFRITLTLLIVSLLVFIYKLRLSNIKKQKDALEQLVAYRTKEVMIQKEEILTQKESISKQNNELVALNEEKNELIQIVAHDLRSPLNQIKGMTMIIKLTNPNLDEETSKSIDTIADLVERQLNMISKVLDVNAIEAHKINLQMTKTPVNEVLSYLVNNFKIIADKKEINLIKAFFPEDINVKVDRNYLIQILENIIANAIKFSPRRKDVTIESVLEDNKVRILVKDQGPGISKKDKLLLFHSFTKLTAKPTAGEASTGLGLSIAKKYVEAMDGKIWCVSEINEGACFIIEFEQFQKDLTLSS